MIAFDTFLNAIFPSTFSKEKKTYERFSYGAEMCKTT